MFGLGQKENKGEKIVFKVEGMHCVSCSLTIDGALEEVEGVHSARTSYASATTTVFFDPELVMPERLQEIVVKEGYAVVASNQSSK